MINIYHSFVLWTVCVFLLRKECAVASLLSLVSSGFISNGNNRNDSFVIGIDCGTESARVGMFNCYSGELISSGVAEYRTGTTFPRPGWAEQEPMDWWEAVGVASRNCLASVADKLEFIKGLSIDTTCCSVIALDKNFNPLRPCLLWMDSRSAPQTEAIMNLAKGDSSLYVNNDGEGPISAEWMIPKALWIKENEPEIWKKAKYICEKLDYLNYKMTGELCASGCNVAARWHWDAELACNSPNDVTSGRPLSLLKKIGMSDILQKWPTKCIEMGRRVGYVNRDAMKHLGLRSDLSIPVLQGGPDAYVGMVGLGCVKPGRTAVITGSSHLHLKVIPQTKATTRRGRKGVWGPYSGAPFLGRMFAEGGQSSTGSVLVWTKRLLNSAAAQDDQLSYDKLNQEAAEISIGSDGLLSLATFQGARTPVTDSLLRGAIIGLTLSHGRAHIWRAMLESVCYGTKAAIDALQSACESHDDLESDSIAVAGGSTRSEFWLQMHADVMGKKVTVGKVDNAPLLGCAILAAVGAGCYRNEKENINFLEELDAAIDSMVHESRRLEPILENTAQYNRIYSVYTHLTSSLQLISHALSRNETLPNLHGTDEKSLKSKRPLVVMPSILAADFGHLSQEALECEQAGAKWLHVDVCDGGKAWCPGALTLGAQAVAAIHRDCPSLLLDAHVVSDNVDDLLQPLALAGTSRVTFQLEQILLSEDPTDVSPVVALISKIRALNMSVGVCIAPATSAEKLESVLSRLPLSESGEMLIEAVDVLAVSPGFGGQTFNESVLQKVAFIHRKFPGLAFLEVDGGVNMATASLAAEAGANVLIAGSSVFGSDRRRGLHGDSTIKNAIEKLQDILNLKAI